MHRRLALLLGARDEAEHHGRRVWQREAAHIMISKPRETPLAMFKYIPQSHNPISLLLHPTTSVITQLIPIRGLIHQLGYNSHNPVISPLNLLAVSHTLIPTLTLNLNLILILTLTITDVMPGFLEKGSCYQDLIC
ncbi:hypothetical protein H1C71_030483 [Ictidomys tridecemlineatus]|nr:hypothetical protein H1C71_030483 [Ictidomys tridecemlineatus]